MEWQAAWERTEIMTCYPMNELGGHVLMKVEAKV